MFVKRENEIPPLDDGSMLVTPYFTKFEEVHILYTIQDIVEACCL
jgi:hypothetical protein